MRAPLPRNLSPASVPRLICIRRILGVVTRSATAYSLRVRRSPARSCYVTLGVRRARPGWCLFATIVFGIGNFAPLGAILRLNWGRAAHWPVHFIISVYGGYFGGGIGLPDAGGAHPVRHAGHQRDERPQDGARGRDDVTAIAAFVVADVVRWARRLSNARWLGGRVAMSPRTVAAPRPAGDQGVHRRIGRRLNSFSSSGAACRRALSAQTHPSRQYVRVPAGRLALFVTRSVSSSCPCCKRCGPCRGEQGRGC